MFRSEIDYNRIREYIVTVKQGVDWRELHNELIRDTASDDSVDSNIVPDRECHCCKERAINPRNTHYHLTENEAIKLRQDPRVIDVMAIEDKPKPTPSAVQDGNFNRTSTSVGTHDNWGLLRHISETNTFNNSTADPGGTYDYVLDGTGVDVVILDSGVQVGHPEWEDANGVSRLKQVDWPTISGQAFTQPASFYTDTNGHGTHCTGTVAGKTFGWAKNADIYTITLSDLGFSWGITWADAIDAILGWHTKKNNPSDPAYTGRPTVVNMSIGYSSYIWTGTPNQFSFTSTGFRYDILGGSYRGTAHSDTTNLTGYGLPPFSSGYATFPIKVASDDADITTLTNAGIHICIAAGNSSTKADVPGGADYNNYIVVLNNSNLFYYNRGSSPSYYEGGKSQYFIPNDGNGIVNSGTNNDAFNIGALDVSDVLDNGVYKDKKVSFSNSGPGVDIYSAGTWIMSARPTSGFSTPYFANASYRQQKISGTSMASPQMCGMVACLLQAHPDWTPAQVKKYFTTNAKANMYTTGLDNDYSVTNTIHGGPNRTAYFPMNGQIKFNHSSGTLASYSLTADKSSADEGENVTYTLNTTGLPDGTFVTARLDTLSEGYNVNNLLDLGETLLFPVSFNVSNNTATESVVFPTDSFPDGVGRPTGVWPFNETVSYPLTDKTYSVAPKVIDSVTFGMLAGDPSNLDLNSTLMQRWTLSQYSCTINGSGQINNIKMDVASNYLEDYDLYYTQNNENNMVALPASTDITDKQSIANAIASVYDWSTGTFTDSNYGEISARVSGTKEPGAELARLRLSEVILPGSSEAIDIKNQNITVDVTVNDTSVISSFDYYYVYMSAGPYVEGNSITFTIKGYNTPPTNSLTWSVSGLGSSTVTAGDFEENTVSGSVTLQNGTATVTLTPAQDLTTEGAEFMVFEVRGTGEWTSLSANQYFTVEANAT